MHVGKFQAALHDLPLTLPRVWVRASPRIYLFIGCLFSGELCLLSLFFFLFLFCLIFVFFFFRSLYLSLSFLAPILSSHSLLTSVTFPLFLLLLPLYPLPLPYSPHHPLLLLSSFPSPLPSFPPSLLPFFLPPTLLPSP